MTTGLGGGGGTTHPAQANAIPVDIDKNARVVTLPVLRPLWSVFHRCAAAHKHIVIGPRRNQRRPRVDVREHSFRRGLARLSRRTILPNYFAELFCRTILPNYFG